MRLLPRPRSNSSKSGALRELLHAIQRIGVSLALGVFGLVAAASLSDCLGGWTGDASAVAVCKDSSLDFEEPSGRGRSAKQLLETYASPLTGTATDGSPRFWTEVGGGTVAAPVSVLVEFGHDDGKIWEDCHQYVTVQLEVTVTIAGQSHFTGTGSLEELAQGALLQAVLPGAAPNTSSLQLAVHFSNGLQTTATLSLTSNPELGQSTVTLE